MYALSFSKVDDDAQIAIVRLRSSEQKRLPK